MKTQGKNTLRSGVGRDSVLDGPYAEAMSAPLDAYALCTSVQTWDLPTPNFRKKEAKLILGDG